MPHPDGPGPGCAGTVQDQGEAATTSVASDEATREWRATRSRTTPWGCRCRLRCAVTDARGGAAHHQRAALCSRVDAALAACLHEAARVPSLPRPATRQLPRLPAREARRGGGGVCQS